MHRLLTRRLLATTLGMAGVVVAAGRVTAADASVLMGPVGYAPASLHVVVGDRVTWRNGDTTAHDASGLGWSTPRLGDGESASMRFATPGTYRYACSVDPSMHGSIVVSAAARPGITHPPTDAVARPAGDIPPEETIAWLGVAAGLAVFGVGIRRRGASPS